MFWNVLTIIRGSA